MTKVTQLLAASPVGHWPLYQLDGGGLVDMTTWYNIVGSVGAVSWLAAYIVIIRGSAAQRTYGVPLVAIALNFTWELMDSFVLPDPVGVWVWVDRSWFIVDILIASQLVRFGRAEQILPELKKAFLPVVALTFVLAFWGQYAWVTTFEDTLGIILAFVINLVMSILYVRFYFARRDTGHGLSLPAAWLKLVGTALSSVQCAFLLPIIHPVAPSRTALPTYAFFHFLFVGCFLFDAMYVWLLTTRRRLSGTPKASPLAS